MRLADVSALTSAAGWKSDRTSWNNIRKGVVPPTVAIRIGRSVRINLDALDEWLSAGGTNPYSKKEAQHPGESFQTTAPDVALS